MTTNPSASIPPFHIPTSFPHTYLHTLLLNNNINLILIKDIDVNEKVQRRFIKPFPNLRDLPYPIRIARLNIIPLGERRSNIDLITSYRILNNLVHHTSFQFFTLRSHNLTRGHSLILSKPKVRLNVSKFSFYSRVVDPWNLLPDRVVSAGTLPTFKFLLKTLHL